MQSKKFFRARQLSLLVESAAGGLVAGCDEVGRGPLAGPVVAAAVILDERRRIHGLNDSKLLSALQRERLDAEIRDKALCVSIGMASVSEIDAINILQASLLAMQRAVEGLRLAPQLVLVDGNQRPRIAVACKTVVGGDAKVRSISAASIVAKVYRDALCDELHAAHPGYGFDAHKGYSTPEHLEALERLGPCPHHRRSFARVRLALGEALDSAELPWSDAALAED